MAAVGCCALTAEAASPPLPPSLFVAGRLADFDHRPLRVRSASASILAVDRGGGGIASIAVAVDGRRVAREHLRCPHRSCPRTATLRFEFRRGRFGAGGHRIRVTATDGRGAVASRTIVTKPPPARPHGPPRPLPAFYITAADAKDLRHQAYDDAAKLARVQHGGRAVLLLDFGAARHHGSRWGTRLRGGTFFANAEIGAALDAAARGYHAQHRTGKVAIAYVNTNALLGRPGHGDTRMNAHAGREAGVRQARSIRRLRLFPGESAALGGDIEPGYDLFAPPRVSLELVGGATSAAAGRPYYDVGTAPCRGRRCINGWTLNDICRVAAARGVRALPEVYYERPTDEAAQWAAAQSFCGISSFAGASGSRLAAFSPAESWRLLNAKTHGPVGRVVVVFPR